VSGLARCADLAHQLGTVASDAELHGFGASGAGPRLGHPQGAQAVGRPIELQVGSADFGEHALHRGVGPRPVRLDAEDERRARSRGDHLPRHRAQRCFVEELASQHRERVDHDERYGRVHAPDRLDEGASAVRGQVRGCCGIELAQDELLVDDRRCQREPQRGGLLEQQRRRLGAEEGDDVVDRERGRGDLEREHRSSATGRPRQDQGQSRSHATNDAVDDRNTSPSHTSPPGAGLAALHPIYGRIGGLEAPLDPAA
jgi:hypothetical protein